MVTQIAFWWWTSWLPFYGQQGALWLPMISQEWQWWSCTVCGQCAWPGGSILFYVSEQLCSGIVKESEGQFVKGQQCYDLGSQVLVPSVARAFVHALHLAWHFFWCMYVWSGWVFLGQCRCNELQRWCLLGGEHLACANFFFLFDREESAWVQSSSGSLMPCALNVAVGNLGLGIRKVLNFKK